MPSQPTIHQIIDDAWQRHAQAQTAKREDILARYQACQQAILSLPQTILELLAPYQTPKYVATGDGFMVVINSTIQVDGFDIPIKFFCQWSERLGRPAKPTLTIADHDIDLHYDEQKLLANIGDALRSTVFAATLEAATRRANRFVRIESHLSNYTLAIDELADLEAGEFPELAEKYAAYKAHTQRKQQLAALRNEFKSACAAWQAAGAEWAEQWTERITSTHQTGALWFVRYAPIAPSYGIWVNRGNDDAIRVIVTATHPSLLTKPASACIMVETNGQQTPTIYIGAFLDAVPVPAPQPTTTHSFAYHRTIWWGDRCVNIPHDCTIQPDAAPPAPDWHQFVATNRPDLLDLIEDDMPF